MSKSSERSGYEEMGWEILAKDLHALPNDITKFHRNKITANQQSWGSVFASYDAALKIMLAEVDKGNEYISQPTFYLMRHSIELCIKSTIQYYSKVTGRSSNLSGHSILTLWNELREQFNSAGYTKENDWDKHCEKIIRHFHDCDPSGDRFRYPADKKGKSFNLSKVEWQHAYAAYLHIAYICECAEEMLDDLGVVPPGYFDKKNKPNTDDGIIDIDEVFPPD